MNATIILSALTSTGMDSNVLWNTLKLNPLQTIFIDSIVGGFPVG